MRQIGPYTYEVEAFEYDAIRNALRAAFTFAHCYATKHDGQDRLALNGVEFVLDKTLDSMTGILSFVGSHYDPNITYYYPKAKAMCDKTPTPSTSPLLVSMDKKYKTTKGFPVRVFAVDRKVDGNEYCVAAAVDTGRSESLSYFTLQGKAHSSWDGDLIEVKPRIKREAWMNVYNKPFAGGGFGGVFCSKAQADESAHGRARWGMPDGCVRVACVKITVDVEEGEGL